MAEKIIQTRIINKNSALTEWLSSKFNLTDDVDGAERLKKGEIALAYVETAHTDAAGNIVLVPTYMLKVGDGVSRFSDLEWLAAPASDVYAWAKASDITYEDGVLTLVDGAYDGSDITFNFKSTFYSKDEVNQLLSTKADLQHGTHVVWASHLPRMDGAGTPGTSERAARSDHIHPTDTSRAAAKHTHTAADLVGSVYTYRGTKESTDQLPSEGNLSGDVWNITKPCEATDTLPKVGAGDNVVWDGKAWNIITVSGIDASTFYTKEQADAKFLTYVYVGKDGTPTSSVQEDPYFNVFDGMETYNSVQFEGGDGVKVASTDTGSIKIDIFPSGTNYIFNCGNSKL